AVDVGRQLLNVDAGGTERHRDDLFLQLAEVEVALTVEEVEERELEPLRERRTVRERLTELAGARADRARRHAVLRRLAQDDVLVAVVRLGRRAHLRPLPAEEGDEIGILRIAGD